MPRLTVLLPQSFASDVPGLREATSRIGFVGRVLATFRADTLLLYPDSREKTHLRNAGFIREVLEYLVTAPYLRKQLYPLKPSLRYAGLLPPLNIPTHPEAEAAKTEGTHYRQALVLSSGETSLLEAGLGRPLRIRGRLPKNSLVVLKVKVAGKHVKYKVVSKRSREVYNGFRTRIVNSLDEALKQFDYRVATSRLGKPINQAIDKLSQSLKSAKEVCVVFGSADRGLHRIVEDLGLDYNSLFDITVNTVPEQGVKTIRTEEALAYTLAVLNLAARM
jgi:predicted SPOUT superfamily RNA methylase MTH1